MAEGSSSDFATPFSAGDELYSVLSINAAGTSALLRTDGHHSLPGNPFVELEYQEIHRHLSKTLETKRLDGFTRYFIFVATPSSSSVTPLHQQGTLGRSISVNNSADLHLVWYHDRIFVKPLPPYLLSHAFWSYMFERPRGSITDAERERLHRAAIGFIRSYVYLIRDELDFDLAVEHKLIPKDITLLAFAKFMTRFKNIPDEAVTPRFRYGELRLSRLNLWAPIALGRFDYFNTTRQSDSYFSRFFSPLLFAFALVSVLLSAMQVALATEPSNLTGSWATFAEVCRWTSVVSIMIFTFAATILLTLFLSRILNQFRFALKASWARERRRTIAKTVTDAME